MSGKACATTVRIEGIFVAAEASGDMISKQSATLIEGVGLEGDRYARGMGTYSVLQEPGRQLTLISADEAEVALSSLLDSKHQDQSASVKVDSIGSLRRNVVLRGISAVELRSAIGSVIQFGENASTKPCPQVFVHRNCVPWCVVSNSCFLCTGYFALSNLTSSFLAILLSKSLQHVQRM